MSNENRNNYVVTTNIESANVRDLLKALRVNEPNIIETQRDKVFEIADLLKTKDIDFWADNFEFRDIIICEMSLKTIKAMKIFDNYVNLNSKFIKNRKALLDSLNEYRKIDESVSNYDISKDFYRLTCDYCRGMWPSSYKSGYFMKFFTELSEIGMAIDAEQTPDFNLRSLFDILLEKKRDSEKIKKAMIDPDSLSDDEFRELITIGINNHLQMLKFANNDEYKRVVSFLEKKEKKKSRQRNRK